MYTLTQSLNIANLSASHKKSVIGFDDLKPNGTQPHSKRLFIVHRFISLCGIERGYLRVCRLRLAGSSTPLNLAPMFDDIGCGFKNLHKRVSKMKPTSPVQIGQTHPKTTKFQSRFEMFQDGVLIAQNLNSFAAIGLKRMFPEVTIKFAGMVKGGAL